MYMSTWRVCSLDDYVHCRKKTRLSAVRDVVTCVFGTSKVGYGQVVSLHVQPLNTLIASTIEPVRHGLV